MGTVLSIDWDTSSTKAVLVNTAGVIVAQSFTPVGDELPPPRLGRAGHRGDLAKRRGSDPGMRRRRWRTALSWQDERAAGRRDSREFPDSRG